MPLGSNFADLAHKSMVLFLAGTTIYYVTNISIMVKHRMDLKKEGRLEEELARMSAIAFGDKNKSDITATATSTSTTENISSS